MLHGFANLFGHLVEEGRHAHRIVESALAVEARGAPLRVGLGDLESRVDPDSVSRPLANRQELRAWRE